MSDQGGRRPPVRVSQHSLAMWFAGGAFVVLLLMILLGPVIGLQGVGIVVQLLAGAAGLALLVLWDSRERPGEDPRLTRQRHRIVMTIVIVACTAVGLMAVAFGVWVVLILLGVIPLFPNK